LLEEFFKTFTKKQVLDATKGTEVILALSAGSRDEVDDMVMRAAQSGGSAPGNKQDDGFLYGWGFQDPDGHLWEVIYLGSER
jgi:predicted lactoylglutathione lyase